MSKSSIRYDNRVVVITGAGNGLGRQYALFFAARGAKVVVNDLGGTFNGADSSGSPKARVADAVVEEIRASGGIAVANYDSVQQGEKIIATAIQNFGTVHVLINNAGILRDITLRNMKQGDWDLIHDVHLHGAFATTRAAWPYFRKQRFGRVIMTSSASGLFGNFGQSNYASAKMALVGFSATLAREGKKYGIHVNVLAPGAASRLTQTVWTPEMMEVMKPAWVVPIVGVLSSDSCDKTGAIFEAAAGHFSEIRWERSKGTILKPDGSLSADVILANWDKIVDWTDAEHPTNPGVTTEKLEQARALATNKVETGNKVSLKGKVALVTGAGAGLGRAYAIALAKLGATVVVNDIKDAEKVASEITKAGGEATAVTRSVVDGAAVVQDTVQKYGRIDVLVNNAGQLGDRAFQNMTKEQWDAVIGVHLGGTYAVTRAAYPYMHKQRYGRIVNITSTSGIYGNFGQANYSAAKCGIIGFSKTISREGAKYNIYSNTVAPTAGTNMTRTIWPEEQVQALKPEYVAPLVAALCSEKPPATGHLIEAGGGWFAATRWQRARGVDFEHAKGVPTVEDVAEAFSEICNFDNGQADNPDLPSEGSKYTMGNVLKNPALAGKLKPEDRENRKNIAKAHKAKL